MNPAGTVAAIVGVVSTSAQQILVAHLQKKHNVTSNFLLAKTSPYMAGSITSAPRWTSSSRGSGCSTTSGLPSHVRAAGLVLFAVLVNVSSFLCIGRFSAVSFQVIGHVKTCLVFFFVLFATHHKQERAGARSRSWG